MRVTREQAAAHSEKVLGASGLCNQMKRATLLGLELDGYRPVATPILGGVHHE